jgi:hypothetical protein
MKNRIFKIAFIKIIPLIILLLTILIFNIILFLYEGNNFVGKLPEDVVGSIPPDGFVPDKKTAIRIAKTVWLPIYGKKVLFQKPYKAILIDEKIWVVEGSLIIPIIPIIAGGTAHIEIDKDTGKILKVIHTK